MEQKKAFEKPETGPFYLIPDPKTGKYTMFSGFDEPGKEEVHLFIWSSVIEILRRRFKGADVDSLEDMYRGLPRGRIMLTGENSWVVGHGNDFPLSEYKNEIISEFKLRDAENINKVAWDFNSHETMIKPHKAAVESALGITITPQGFKVKGKTK